MISVQYMRISCRINFDWETKLPTDLFGFRFNKSISHFLEFLYLSVIFDLNLGKKTYAAINIIETSTNFRLNETCLSLREEANITNVTPIDENIRRDFSVPKRGNSIKPVTKPPSTFPAILKKYTVPIVLPSLLHLDSANNEISGKLAPIRIVGSNIKNADHQKTSTSKYLKPQKLTST